MHRSHRFIHPLLVVAAVAILAAAAACGSDSPTGPGGSAVTTQQAYSIFTAHTGDQNPATADIALLGQIVAAMGAPVVDLPVTIGGQPETFHALALKMRRDTNDVAADSLIVVVGWRGDNTAEMILAAAVSDTAGSGRAGYPLGEIMYANGPTTSGDYAADDGSVTLAASPAAGTCTPATVGNDPLIAAVQSSRVSCGGATFTGGYTGPLFTDSADLPISLSLGGMPGISVKAVSQGVSLDRLPRVTFRAAR